MCEILKVLKKKNDEWWRGQCNVYREMYPLVGDPEKKGLDEKRFTAEKSEYVEVESKKGLFAKFKK
jgi:hypothetical protein